MSNVQTIPQKPFRQRLIRDIKRYKFIYLLGFLCHYLLDSTVHPLVYANQYALCDAGIDGLSREDGSEVHAVIESAANNSKWVEM